VPEETVVAAEDEAKPEKKSPFGKIGKVLLIVLLAVASSAGGGVVSFVLMKRALNLNGPQKDAEQVSKEEEEKKIAEQLEKSAVLPLEPFVVNLADQDAARYLRIRISLMVGDKTKSKELFDNQALQLKVRDVILQSLTAKTSQELINTDGKNKLRQEIQEKVAVYFQAPKLVDVVFTEFVIQL
jgi:flagellar FliL protein